LAFDDQKHHFRCAGTDFADRAGEERSTAPDEDTVPSTGDTQRGPGMSGRVLPTIIANMPDAATVGIATVMPGRRRAGQ